MAFSATIVRVLVASPGDVEDERRSIINVISAWNSINAVGAKVVLLPVLWERDARPERGTRPQAIINKQLVKDCDILIATFWTRLGTPTGVESSGTVEEIEEFYKSNRDVLIYFSTKEVSPTRVNTEQLDKLNEYKNKISGDSLYFEYNSIDEFERLLLNHLSKTIQDKFLPIDIKEIKKIEHSFESYNSQQIKDSFLDENNGNSTNLSKIKFEFHNQLLYLQEMLQENSMNQTYPLDNLKQSISRIHYFIEKIYHSTPESFDSISDEIEKIIFDLNDLATHKIYMDGGYSYEKFWMKSDNIVKYFKSTIELM